MRTLKTIYLIKIIYRKLFVYCGMLLQLIVPHPQQDYFSYCSKYAEFYTVGLELLTNYC